MEKKIKVLFIGESWMVHTVETKGFDTFSADSYGLGTQYIKAALSAEDMEFHHLPCHLVDTEFPSSMEALKEYQAVFISDVGANTFLLPVETFLQSKRTPNKLKMLRDYVLDGGGLCMVGGYLSFMGIEGKGRYHHTPVEEVLPVDFLAYDDRAEHPEGIDVKMDAREHDILKGVPAVIEGILGYNRAIPKKESQVLAQYEGDPIIAVGQFGKGRSVAFTTDCAPHWCPVEFCETEGYRRLFRNMVRWMANADHEDENHEDVNHEKVNYEKVNHE